MPKMGEPILLQNHLLMKRIEAIISISKKYALDIVDAIKIEVGENGVLSYSLNKENVQFTDCEKDLFRMELKELASVSIDSSEDTILDMYTFQGKHSNLETKTWKSNSYIRFDFAPDTVNYPTVHINAYKKKWGNHLSYPESTNLNLSKMSCPLAIEVFRKYALDREVFPTDQKENRNEEYVKLFEEVSMYGI